MIAVTQVSVISEQTRSELIIGTAKKVVATFASSCNGEACKT